MKILQSITIFVFLLLSYTGFTQNSDALVRFRQLTINEGLTHTDATSITQDEQGFIWIGTYDGLQRFDGYQLKTYINNISPSKRIYNNRILKVVAHNNYLWLGTQGGLHCYDIKKEQFISLTIVNDKEEILKGNLTILDIDKEGNLWVGNQTNMFLANFNAETKELVANDLTSAVKDFPNNYPPVQYFCIENDNSDNYWLATNKGLIQLRKNENHFQFYGLLQPRNKNKRLDPVRWVSYKKGALWLISDDAIYGYYVGPGSIVSNDNLIKSIPEIYHPKTIYGEQVSMTPNALLVDHNNSLWGISASGLWKIEKPMQKNVEVTLFQHSKGNPFSLSSNTLNSMIIDQSNCLWVSSWGGGLNYLDLDLKRFHLMNQNPEKPFHSLNDDFIRCMIKASDGLLYIGTRGGGLNIYNPETRKFEFLKHKTGKQYSLPDNQVRVIRQIENQNILIGTGTGVSLYNTKTKQLKAFPDPVLKDQTLFAAEIDHTGQIWAGSWGAGVFVVKKQENNQWTSYNISDLKSEKHHITSNSINYIFADHSKREILVSTNKGLNRIKLNSKGEVIDITHYISQPEYAHSIDNNFVWPIVKQNDSVYWIGSLGGGLNKFTFLEGYFDDGTGKYKARIYTTEDGAPGNQVESLILDNNNHLWIGGKGLSRFNPITEEFWNFDVNDGLQSNGFKIGSAFMDREGFCYFGGIAGMNYFKPGEIQKNNLPPNIVISDVFIRNKELKVEQGKDAPILKQSISFTNEINLESDQNDITLRFSSLHFANPIRCKYRYKLLGFDNEWNYTTGTLPQASFSNLKFGDYEFIVEASNNDGLWGKESATLKINIAAPWYSSTLAYIIYMVFFFLLVTLGIVYFSNWLSMKHNLQLKVAEEKRIKEIHSMKLQFFTNISHEFKNPLSLILTPVEEMLEKDLSPTKRIEYLQIIQKNARRMLKLINELMDFRKAELNKVNLQTEYGELGIFIAEISNQFNNYAKTKGIHLELESNNTQMWFDKEIVSKIVNNLLSNALKFTNENGIIKVKIYDCDSKNTKAKFAHSISDGADLETNQYCCIQILDNGVGISEASLPRIFDRFFHIDSKSNNHLGSGVGLALVKTLVIAHKGQITVSSEREKGTEFIIKLPLGEEHLKPDEKLENSDFILENEIIDPDMEDETIKAIEEPEVSEQEEKENKEIILVIEDNEDLRKMVVNHFKENFNVIDAPDGDKGLELAQETLPDLIISDIMMPGINGIELCKTIKQDINTSHIPIVLLTAKTSLEDQIIGAESGADIYVAKPFSMKLLDLKVTQLIESRNFLKDRYVKDFYGETREIAQNTKDKEFLDTLINIIEENIENSEFSVQILCREVGMCRTNLYKKVRSLTNQSLGDFIRMLRLKNAAKILMEEDVTVSESALRVGINSTSYFTKAFKVQYNMTPTQFLNKYRNGES